MALLIILFLLVFSMGSMVCVLESVVRPGASRKDPVFLAEWEIKLVKKAWRTLVSLFR